MAFVFFYIVSFNTGLNYNDNGKYNYKYSFTYRVYLNLKSFFFWKKKHIVILTKASNERYGKGTLMIDHMPYAFIIVF